MLTHWTRKILVEEGHSVGQLVHILQLVVRHANVYYPVRHHLTHHITQAMHRLGFTPTANLDQRRLAVDLAEVSACSCTRQLPSLTDLCHILYPSKVI